MEFGIGFLIIVVVLGGSIIIVTCEGLKKLELLKNSITDLYSTVGAMDKLIAHVQKDVFNNEQEVILLILRVIQSKVLHASSELELMEQLTKCDCYNIEREVNSKSITYKLVDTRYTSNDPNYIVHKVTIPCK